MRPSRLPEAQQSERTRNRKLQQAREAKMAWLWAHLPAWLYAGERAIPAGNFERRKHHSGVHEQVYGESDG